MVNKTDWDGLRTEFLASDESLNQFLLRKNLTRAIYLKAKKGHWVASRERLRAKSALVAEGHILGAMTARWETYLKLWTEVKSRASELLKDKTIITPSNLRALSQAIDLALRSEKMIVGEPTETHLNVNLHSVIVGELSKMADKKGVFDIRKEDLIDDRSVEGKLPVEVVEAEQPLSDKGQASPIN